MSRQNLLKEQIQKIVDENKLHKEVIKTLNKYLTPSERVESKEVPLLSKNTDDLEKEIKSHLIQISDFKGTLSGECCMYGGMGGIYGEAWGYAWYALIGTLDLGLSLVTCGLAGVVLGCITNNCCGETQKWEAIEKDYKAVLEILWPEQNKEEKRTRTVTLFIQPKEEQEQKDGEQEQLVQAPRQSFCIDSSNKLQ